MCVCIRARVYTCVRVCVQVYTFHPYCTSCSNHLVFFPQINYVTSWIDGSFVYSTSEARLNMLRSFTNGTFRTDPEDEMMPPRNSERIPMENNPVPHVLKILNPEDMFCKSDLSLFYIKKLNLAFYIY